MKNKNFLRVFYVSLLLVGMSMACSSCSSEDEMNEMSTNHIPTSCLGDYVKDMENVTGVLCHHDNPLNMWYIEDSDKNRFYLFDFSDVIDSPSREGATALYFGKRDPLEGDKVLFTGKVYALNEEWIESTEELAKLSEGIQLYGLQLPEYTITLVDD